MATGTQNASLVSAAKPMSAAGAVFVAPLGTKLPTSVDEELDSKFQTLGYISEDGITNSIDDESETVTAFGGETVLTILSSRTETFTFRPIEINKAVLAAQWGTSNVEGTDDDGLTVKHTTDDAEECVYVFAMALNAGRKQILACPKAKLTELGENAYVTNDAQGHEMTVTAMPDDQGVSVYQHVSGAKEGV